MPPGNSPNVRPNFWAKWAVNHTKKTCIAAYSLPLVSIIIIVLLRHFMLDDPATVDFYVRDDIRTRLHDARDAARHQFELDPNAAVVERQVRQLPDAINLLLRGKLSDSSLPVTDEQKRRARNVFSRRNLALLKQAEDLLLNSAQYQQFCLFDPTARDCNGQVRVCSFPKSLLNSRHLYGIWQDGLLCDRSEGHQLPSASAFRNFVDSLFSVDADGNTVTNPAYARFMGNDFSPNNRSTWLMRSVFDIGAPFANFTSLEDRPVEQEERYLDWVNGFIPPLNDLSTERTDVSFLSLTYANSTFAETALRDLSFAVVAITFVFLLIWGHSGSAFLAAAAMAQIFISFPFAYLLYRYVFQQQYFSSLQILSIFLILGIGADDVFVFTDAWKQSMIMLGPEYDDVTRLSWTYRRAVRAMGVTSVTTASAFFVTATSSIMPISSLGVWAGTLVLAQFVLVITAYPCALIIWHRFWRTKRCLPCLPKRDEPQAPNRKTPFSKFLPNCWGERDGTELQYRRVERFFRGPWVKVIHKLRFVLILLALSLIAVGVFLATKLEPVRESEAFLPDSNTISLRLTAIGNDIPATELESRLQVRLMWGILDVNRSGTSKFEPEETGTAILDRSFDLRSREAQSHLLNVCSRVENVPRLLFSDPAIGDPLECWIRDYELWRRDVQGKEEFETFESHAEQVQDLVEFANFTVDEEKPYMRYLESQQIAFDQDRSRVVFTELRFTTPHLLNLTGRDVDRVYDEWIDIVNEINRQGPDGVNRAAADGGSIGATPEGANPWLWVVSQRTLVRNMFVGVGIMMGVSILTLTFSTLNWIVAVIATFCIGGIVSMLLAFIYLMGWELGITETISVVISIGYSFDGVAHIATAYVESSEESRLERTRHALFTLGVSIWFGCLTTLAATIWLFPAIITFFVKFAGMLTATILLSLLWSLTFFPALLIVIGPTGTHGSLAAIWNKIVRKPREKDKAFGKEESTGRERTRKSTSSSERAEYEAHENL